MESKEAKNKVHEELSKLCINNQMSKEEYKFFVNHIKDYSDYYSDFFILAVESINNKVLNILQQVGFDSKSSPEIENKINYLIQIKSNMKLYQYFNIGYRLPREYEDYIIEEAQPLIDNRFFELLPYIEGLSNVNTTILPNFSREIIRQRKIHKILNRNKIQRINNLIIRPLILSRTSTTK